jgi:hypothetical protein
MHTFGGCGESEELDQGILVIEAVVEILPDLIDQHGGGLRCLPSR